jgi:hypothetical protein
VIGVFTFATDERRCFNFHKKDFIDPESAYLDSSFIWTKKDEQETAKEHASSVFDNYEAVLNVKVFARNRMGGYVSNYLECPLVNGHFDEHAAFMFQYESTPQAAPAAEAAPAIEP